jgi:sulfite exporter TauE/SafE
MKSGLLTLILGVLISTYPVIILAICLTGKELHGDAVIAYSAFAIIGVMLICTGLILNELTKLNRQ